MTELLFSRTEILSGLPEAAAATGITLLCGIITAIVYRLGADKPSKYMMVSTLIIPTIVQAVIMMVNGSIGAGVAAAGAFSLVRFRSIPGSSRDICILFLGMAAGLVAGMGFLGYALAVTVVLGVVIVLAEKLLPPHGRDTLRQLKITIPEDMDYSGVFDEILDEYTSSHRMTRVRTVRMGTMYELIYDVHVKKSVSEKEMLDRLRSRNGNLTVCLGIVPDAKEEL
ncbi:MAG: DUF4956 domain-containing protein [Oscillospiraceae bacterium]|nr:DUF4956 domain-containing protein [Oscillospiraceae bacterium]